MKRIIALTFLTIYLLSATELHQYLKIPLLIEHYSEHKQKDSKITFLKFLHIHYNYTTKKDADYDKDSKLPFKSIDSCNSTNFISILPEQKVCFNSITIPSKKMILNNHYPNFSNSTYLKSIWQPPKFS